MTTKAINETDELEIKVALIADEYSARIARGESPDVDALAAHVPGSERTVREVLHTLQMMHRATSPSHLLDSMPTKIGDFEIIDEIGRGGMGVVYLAKQSSSSLKVAIKVLPPSASNDFNKRKRFDIEMHSASILQHPNIVPVIRTGIADGIRYYAMQFIEGTSLELYLRKQRIQSNAIHESDVSQIVKWIRNLALALQHAHNLGVIHRDIKPSNILLDDAGKVWITDFGLARVEMNQSLTATGDIVGTLRYMSPEQALPNNKPIDHRCDIYSLGATLYELLTRKPMIRGNEHADILRQLTLDEPIRIRSIDPSLSRELETIVMKATAKERDHRYETATALADDLERFLQHRPILARRASFASVAVKLARKNRFATLLLAVIPLIVMTALIINNIQIAHQKDRAEAALVIAEKNERQANEETLKATAISRLLQSLVSSANPDQSKGNDYTVRQLLDDVSDDLFVDLADQADVEASLRTTIGNAYRRLGAPEKASPHLERALHLNKEGGWQKKSESLENLAWNMSALGKYTDAVSLASDAAKLFEGTTNHNEAYIRTLWCLQHAMIYAKQLKESDDVALKAIAIAQSLIVMPPETANIYHEYAKSRQMQGQLDEAIQLASKAVDMHQRLRGNSHPETGWGYDALGRAYQAAGDLDNAEAAFQSALSIFKTNYSDDHKSIRMTQELLDQIHVQSGKTIEIEKLAQRRTDQVIDKVFSDAADNGSLIEHLLKHDQFDAAAHLIFAMESSIRDTQKARKAIDVLEQCRPRLMTIDSNQETVQRIDQSINHLFSIAIDECPDDAGTKNDLAWELVVYPRSTSTQFEQSIELAKQATKASPEFGTFWNTLGVAFYRNNQFAEAKLAIEKARTFADSDEYDIIFLAMIESQLGNDAQALEHYIDATKRFKQRSNPTTELVGFFEEAKLLLDKASHPSP
jgi:serine/threonine protein kinase/Flp pilus assembly protein TadD